jgi:hypothetical protein
MKLKINVPSDKEKSLENTVLQANHYSAHCTVMDRLCGLVVRVLGYRSGGPGSIPGTTKKKKK